MSLLSNSRLLKRVFGSNHIFNKKEQDNAEDTQLSSLEPGNRENTEAVSAMPGADDIEYEVVEREIHPSKIICPDCGGITLEGLDFCDKCGGLL